MRTKWRKINNLKTKKKVFIVLILLYIVSVLTIDIGISNKGPIKDFSNHKSIMGDAIDIYEHKIVAKEPIIESSKITYNRFNDYLIQNELYKNEFNKSDSKIVLDLYFIPPILQELVTLAKVNPIIDILLLVIIFFLEKILIFIQNNDGKKKLISSYSYLCI